MRAFRLAGPLETERLVLRTFTPDDVDDSFAYQSREDVTRYLLFDALTRDEVAERIANRRAAVSLENDGDWLILAIELKNGRDAASPVIGDITVRLKSAADGTAEIGWVTHPDFHRRGYTAEAARAVLDLLFHEVRLHRVYAELDPRNAASIALCSALGMREEAHFVEDVFVKGEWADTGVYALLAREWPAPRR
jgi:RimJ/RimL family protein N-acetyltransferase